MHRSSTSLTNSLSWLAQRRRVPRAVVVAIAFVCVLVASCRDSNAPAPLAPRALTPARANNLGRVPNGGTRADSLAAISAARARPANMKSAASRIRSNSTNSLLSLPQLGCGVADYTLPRGVLLLTGASPDPSVESDPVADAFNSERPDCGPHISVSPTTTPPLYQSSNPDNGPIQEQPLRISFDTAVGSVAVFSMGAITCIGTNFGTLVAFDSAGHELDRSALALRDSSDCGSDSVTFGVYGSVSAGTSAIRAVTILAPQPFVFPVYIPPDPSGNDTVTGHLTQDYELYIGGPVAGRGELSLTCTSPSGVQGVSASLTIVRADTVTCRASATGGPLSVSDWRFASSDQSFTLNRRDVEFPFSPDAVWSGVVVTPGAVTISATVGGTAKSASVLIGVKARDWSRDTVAYDIVRVPTPFADPAHKQEELGSNKAIPKVIADPFRAIGNGPNTGLAFFATLPFRLTFNVNYNTNAMQLGSTFARMQPFATTAYKGVTYCARGRVTSDTTLVMAHEGFRAADANSHTDSYKSEFLRLARIAVEPLVGPAQNLTIDSVLLNNTHNAAFARSAFITDSAANPYRSNCVFNYDPTLRIP